MKKQKTAQIPETQSLRFDDMKPDRPKTSLSVEQVAFVSDKTKRAVLLLEEELKTLQQLRKQVQELRLERNSISNELREINNKLARIEREGATFYNRVDSISQALNELSFENETVETVTKYF